ncbi:histidinol-phosphate aminotransferase [Tamaricihabitans halophyticus]|uniref:Aminotransferase n=1 Tax=Tamaricihabitans halophyticus TaxID=1262583 RepID=A0A4R2QIN6_9PSEU|nr:Rv2231c family pyridoxal phosphate-dependent protein CobC [Tamaricihabitans halophyticus]TCP48639.1 histidinol-phosphate aminotransferase [Tamaricihabitans halophyticus]
MDTAHAGLRHHGDVEAGPGLLDFAVNVARQRPPGWLRDRLIAALGDIAGYPRAEHDERARAAVAARHRRAVDDVVLLNGAAEGFALLPNLRPRLAALVHPSFTEPEAALRAAEVPVARVLLDESDGFLLSPERVPEAADLVVLGNPTNPTSVLHPATMLRRLARPGRVLVVDEAFADTVPGEPESLAGHGDIPGLLVLRSLTKTWGLAGLRAGYALGAPDLLAALTAQRAQWPVGTLAVEAVLACSEPAAVAEAEAQARDGVAHRAELLARLRELPGLRVYEPAAASFVLVRIPDANRVRAELRAAGIAVRRADTFPGLGPDFLRISVRAPAEAAPLVTALRTVMRSLEVL